MDVHVDWLSFTLKEYEEPRTAMKLYDFAKIQLRKVSHELEQTFYNGQGFDPSTSRPPYRVSIARSDKGARLFGASHTATLLYELSGRGCEPLRNHEIARYIIGSISDTITRIDFAVDIATGTRPTDFANKRSHNRFSSISYINSQSGETVYIGSPKSDRFCRVYRYNPPNPRANLLRVEYVFRRKLAKSTATHYSGSDNIQAFIAELGNTFGFVHPDWQPRSSTTEKISYPIIERGDQDTVSWLYKQVAPAMSRLIEAGALDVTHFLDFVYTHRTRAK